MEDTQLTAYEMIEALPEEDRSEIGYDLVVLAAGEVSSIIHQRSAAEALEVVAKVTRAVAKIDDSIFKSRDRAYREPTEEQVQRHEIKWRWWDLLSAAQEEIQAQVFGDAKRAEPATEEGGDVLSLLQKDRDDSADPEYL